MRGSHFGISERITKIRKQKKLSRETLAKAVGINPGRLGRIERDETSPSLQEVINIALALDVRVVKLLYGDHPNIIDISDHWPGNRSIIDDLLLRLRSREEYMDSQWVFYCKTILAPFFENLAKEGKTVSEDNCPRPPWRMRNIG